MSELGDRFEGRLRDAIRLSIELGYVPTVIIQMLDNHGWEETVDRLIPSGEIQIGPRRMAELGRLDLTIESIMLESEFRPLFPPRHLEAAQWRLDQLQ